METGKWIGSLLSLMDPNFIKLFSKKYHVTFFFEKEKFTGNQLQTMYTILYVSFELVICFLLCNVFVYAGGISMFRTASGMYATFLKGQGHQGIFSWVKGTLHMYEEVVHFYLGISSAPRQ